MRATRMASAVAGSALLLCALAAGSGAQAESQGAPRIRVYSTNGSYVLATTSYVTPVIEVSENAYVFAVSMDLDGQIRVLQPDFPGISVKVQSGKRLQLPNFFTGFSRPNYQMGYSTAGYSGYDNDGFPDSRGTVIALASREPFNLDRVEVNGDWNMSTIRRLLADRSPESAAQALANYLGAKDEPIGRDWMRFAGGRDYNNSYASSAYSSCDLYSYSYAPNLGARFFQASSTLNLLRRRGQVATIGYDFCGFPFVIVHSGSLAGGHPIGRPPRSPADTNTGAPIGRFPRGTPRHPIVSGSKSAPEKIFPLPQREGFPQIRDATITAPRGRHSEPGQILQGYRPSPGIGSAPQGRMPIERVTTPRPEPAASTGSQPVRESRPEPRSAPPPPTRVPDATPRSAPPPAPVVHEAPRASEPVRSAPLQPAPSRHP
jgi:hypothetical protein